ncbi:hypothetical protein GCM10027059_41760 [Myceligenerans halotolerans]
MARKNQINRRRVERQLRVRGVRRDPPDLRKLSRALIDLAQADAEREAQAEHAARGAGKTDSKAAGRSKGRRDA